MYRTRTNPAIIRYGLYLYYSCRSFRLAAKCLSYIVKRSHVAIWKWVQKYSGYADRFKTDRRQVRAIFVDETLVQIEGKDYWLWVAYEPAALNTCLMMHLSRERTIFFVCYQFFKQLRDRYGSRKPIFTDGARWYNDACRWLGLQHRVYGTKLKNLMERFMQQIKDRTECFDDNFPCKRYDCNRQHVWNWLKLFQLYINTGTNREQFMTYLIIDGG
jgi:putative transposase